jgi:hypothetical protein
MKFETLDAAWEAIMPFTILAGVFHTPSNKQIKRVFVGISDQHMSAIINLGIYGTFPVHNFTRSDLDHIQFWVAFFDDSILALDEVLRDADIDDVVKNGLRREVFIDSDNWTEQIKVPKGLSIRMDFISGGHIHYKIIDRTLPRHSRRQSNCTVERPAGGIHNVLYLDPSSALSNMIHPVIYFRPVHSDELSVELVLSFFPG